MPLFDWEKALFSVLHGFNHPALNQVMIFVSSFTPWVPLAFLLLFFVFKSQERRNFFLITFYFFLLMAVSDSSTSYFFKNLFARLRPCHMTEIADIMVNFGQKCGGKNGFFSSHAANSIAMGAFLLSFGKTPKLLHISIWIFLILICYSRIYLGVHLPLDVIVGSLWGLSLAQVWIYLTKNSVKVPSAL